MLKKKKEVIKKGLVIMKQTFLGGQHLFLSFCVSVSPVMSVPSLSVLFCVFLCPRPCYWDKRQWDTRTPRHSDTGKVVSRNTMTPGHLNNGTLGNWDTWTQGQQGTETPGHIFLKMSGLQIFPDPNKLWRMNSFFKPFFLMQIWLLRYLFKGVSHEHRHFVLIW